MAESNASQLQLLTEQQQQQQGRPCAYALCFREIARTAISSYSALFTDAERQTLASFLADDSICESSIRVLSRLSLRKNSWFLNTELTKYIEKGDPDQLVSTIRDLEHNYMVDVIGAKRASQLTFEEVWGAAQQCFRREDWLSLKKKLNLSEKALGGSHAIESLQFAAKRALLTQRTLIGNPTSNLLAKMKSILEEKGKIAAEVFAAKTSRKASSAHPVDLTFAIRIKSPVRDLIRRIQRLMQATDMRTDPFSITDPCHLNAPLLVYFKKLRFPEYRVSEKTNSRIFESQLAFQQWEAAVEIAVLCERAGALDSRINSLTSQLRRNQAHVLGNGEGEGDGEGEGEGQVQRKLRKGRHRKQTVMTSLEYTIEAESILLATDAIMQQLIECVTVYEASCAGSTLERPLQQISRTASPRELTGSLWTFLRKQLGDVLLDVPRYTQPGAAIAAIDRDWLISALRHVLCDSGKSQCDHLAMHSDTHGDTRPPASPLQLATSLQVGVLSAAAACLVQYVEQQQQQRTAGAGKGDDDGDGQAERPDFFVNIDAGSQLTGLCHGLVCELEKERKEGEAAAAAQNYPAAIALLQYLMALPFPYLQHRRGKWLTRLCIDLEHCERQADSLQLAEAGLRDATVKLSDKLALSKRAQKLRRLLKHPTCTSSGDGVLPSISHDQYDIPERDVIADRIFGFIASMASDTIVAEDTSSNGNDDKCMAAAAGVITRRLRAEVQPGDCSSYMSSCIDGALHPMEKQPSGANVPASSETDTKLGKHDNASPPGIFPCSRNRQANGHGHARGLPKGSRGKRKLAHGDTVMDADAATSHWECPRCTFHNAVVSLCCDICGKLRPQDFRRTPSLAPTITASAIVGATVIELDDDSDAFEDEQTSQQETRALSEAAHCDPKEEKGHAHMTENGDVSVICIDSDSDSDGDNIHVNGHITRDVPAGTFDSTTDDRLRAIDQGVSTSNECAVGHVAIASDTYSGTNGRSHLSNSNAEPECEAAAKGDAQGGMRRIGSDEASQDDLVLLGLAPLPAHYPDALTKIAGLLAYQADRHAFSDCLMAITDFERLALIESSDAFSEIEVHGRRYFANEASAVIAGAQVSRRAGKSLFFGRNDDLMSVEDFVREKCYHVDLDHEDADVVSGTKRRRSSRNSATPALSDKDDAQGHQGRLSAFAATMDGGGWQGWHCEGGPLRTLFSLLMWECLFSDVEDVFQTQYQDAPLDLGFPSFLNNRLQLIQSTLDKLLTVSRTELVAWIGSRYRSCYRRQCRGVNWDIPLRHLQLVALSMGNVGLVAVCRALCINYKAFSGGMPDLLLLRVRMRTQCGRCRGGDRDRDGGGDGMKASGTDADGPHGFVSLNALLGEGWEVWGHREKRRLRSQQAAITDLCDLFDSETAPAPSEAEAPMPTAHAAVHSFDMADPSVTAVSLEALQEATEESAGSTFLTGIASSATAEVAAYRDPFHCDEGDLTVPASNLCRCACSSQELEQMQGDDNIDAGGLENLDFEALCVEVKGPNDRLAPHQLLWLHVLASGNVKVAVVRVRE